MYDTNFDLIVTLSPPLLPDHKPRQLLPLKSIFEPAAAAAEGRG